jgi:hypothetical protein
MEPLHDCIMYRYSFYKKKAEEGGDIIRRLFGELLIACKGGVQYSIGRKKKNLTQQQTLRNTIHQFFLYIAYNNIHLHMYTDFTKDIHSTQSKCIFKDTPRCVKQNSKR